MTTPAGWYPQPDGQQRYWDGELWTAHFAPGAPAEAIAPPPLKPEQVTVPNRRFSRATWFGWGGLALVSLIGAMSSGFSGAVIMSGLFALVVGVIALARGRVGWARLGSRAAGGIAVGAALALLTVGGITAPPSTSPTSVSTPVGNGTSTARDAAAKAAAQATAAEMATAAAAASEATAAAEKAAAEASVQAAADAAAAQATADAVAAKVAKVAAAKKIQAAAAASAKAKAAAAKRVRMAAALANARAAAAKKARVAAASARARAAAAAAVAAPPPASSVYYANCTAVREAGAAPIYRGDPGYAPKLDRDNDGIGCE